VASRLKKTDNEADDEQSTKIDIQSGQGEEDGSSSHGASRVTGHDGPQEASPRDEARSSSAT